MNRRLSRIGRLTAMFFIVLAMLFAVLTILQELYCPFHVVKGDSMYPQIETGDAILLSDVDPARIEVGEVIVFHDPEEKGRLVIHRVTAIEDTGFTRLFSTKGDNNPVPDPEKVAVGDVVGGVALKIPGMGSMLDTLTSRPGYVFMIALPVTLSLLMIFILSAAEKTESVRARDAVCIFEPEPTGYDPGPTAG